MRFECEDDPNDLIDAIGDKNFSMQIEENLVKLQRLRGCAVIIDCEDEVEIQITSGYGKAENYAIAEKLLRLLNQDYDFTGAGD